MNELSFNIRLKTVDSPGVWLRSKGLVVFKIDVFGDENTTEGMLPRFPLTLNKTINFRRIIIGGLNQLVHILETECLDIKLIQFQYSRSDFGITLAKFNENLFSLFRPLVIDDNIILETDVELLMTKTSYFPGILNPKISGRLYLEIKSLTGIAGKRPVYSPNTNVCKRLIYDRPKQMICHYRSLCKTHFQTPMCTISFHKKPNAEVCENKTYSDEYKRAVLCHWCNGRELCDCCLCWKYHTTFHLF